MRIDQEVIHKARALLHALVKVADPDFVIQLTGHDGPELQALEEAIAGLREAFVTYDIRGSYPARTDALLEAIARPLVFLREEETPAEDDAAAEDSSSIEEHPRDEESTRRAQSPANQGNGKRGKR